MIVILTALDLEYAAVRAHLSDLRPHHHDAGTVFEVGHLTGRPDCWVALAVIGMGTVNAAAITERAIAQFRPGAVLFVGIAGGLREWIALGDVVVSTKVYAYHGGRVDGEEFLARPQAWNSSHRLVQLAKHVHRRGAWPGATESRAVVHFEPVAAGEVVLNSLTAPEVQRLRSHFNDAAVVETESAGVALAAHLHESTPTIAVRGISDLANGDKQTADGAGWQPVAAASAAAFAAGLVNAIHETATAAAQADSPGPAQVVPQPTPPRVHNTGAHINSVVAGGRVRIDQKVVRYARRHPFGAVVAIATVLALLGWGTYTVVGIGDTTGSAAHQPPAVAGDVLLTTGSHGACGLRDNRTVACWGDQGGEYLSPSGRFTSVAVVNGLGCALRENRTVSCWDATRGSTTTGPSPTPRPDVEIIEPSGEFSAITAGCGIRPAGNIECWAGAPEPPAGRFVAITAGQYETLCAIAEDRNAICWGGSADPAPPGPFVMLSVGGDHACGVRGDGGVACWGLNALGQTVVPDGRYTAVSAGEEHTCALRVDQTIACWGRSKDEQTQPPGGPFVRLGVGTGGEYSCATRSDRTVECWGRAGEMVPPLGEQFVG